MGTEVCLCLGRVPDVPNAWLMLLVVEHERARPPAMAVCAQVFRTEKSHYMMLMRKSFRDKQRMPW